MVVVEESFVNDSCLVKNNIGQSYLNEFVAILFNEEFVINFPNELLNPLELNTKRIFIPASEWLFIKIYCGNKTAEFILRNYINELSKELKNKDLINKLFFIRYNDLEDHIRVRFYLTSPSCFQEVVMTVNNKLSEFIKTETISKISIETYIREIERYGNDSIEIIESIFDIDSFFVFPSPRLPLYLDPPQYHHVASRRRIRVRRAGIPEGAQANPGTTEGRGLREAGTAPASKGQSVTPAEREAHRWAREVGGKEVRIAPSVTGAKVAFLVRPITPFGTPPVTLEGLQGREALAERIKSAPGAGEEILGCFELTTGRPLTPDVQEGKVTFTAGAPREIMKAQSPERMIRLAAKRAEELAKTRKVDDRDKGGRGRRWPWRPLVRRPGSQDPGRRCFQAGSGWPGSQPTSCNRSISAR